jgi:hypothetical protein
MLYFYSYKVVFIDVSVRNSKYLKHYKSDEGIYKFVEHQYQSYVQHEVNIKVDHVCCFHRV